MTVRVRSTISFTAEQLATSADASDHRSGEAWPDYVDRLCGEVAESFQRWVRTTDFRAVAGWPDLKARAAAGFDVRSALVFVAYFVNEQDGSPKSKESARETA